MCVAAGPKATPQKPRAARQPSSHTKRAKSSGGGGTGSSQQQCADCGRRGHMAGDAACPKSFIVWRCARVRAFDCAMMCLWVCTPCCVQLRSAVALKPACVCACMVSAAGHSTLPF